jgi:O-glycosyl hydrolase
VPADLRSASVLALTLGTVLVFGACSRPGAPAASSLSVDGSRRFQRIDGFGVNANPKNWNFSDLTPAIDRLVDDMHASIWRVDVFGESNWIDTPAHLTPSYYSIIYDSPDFQALWRTLAYLNAKGVRTILSASGLVPDWMGGTVINPANEDQFVEMIISVVDYGRRVKGIPITMLSPLNETDLGPPEGPTMGPAQYARLMSKLIVRLQASGYSDVQLISPDVSGVVNAPSFLDAVMSDPTTMAHIQHFGVHDYAGSTGGMNGYLKATAYPDRNLWLTEWSQNATDGWLDNGRAVADEWRFASVMTDALLSLLKGNAAAVLAWDAWDKTRLPQLPHSVRRWLVWRRFLRCTGTKPMRLRISFASPTSLSAAVGST